MLPSAPYRGRFGDPRPAEVAALSLPPLAMPSRRGLRPLKSWRYVGVFGPQLMMCVAAVRLGPARQWFWAVWDRERGRLDEQTIRRPGTVELGVGRAAVRARELRFELRFTETAGIETVSASGQEYAWTRKQGGVAVTGELTTADGVSRAIDAHGVVDDSAGYHERHVHWRWCAGVGTADDGRSLAWNLVDGIHDDPRASERTVWIDGEAVQAPPTSIADDLSGVGALVFRAEAERRQRDNLVLVRSRYRQPFGTFSGGCRMGPSSRPGGA